ncbi:MAG: hypothetical protein JNL57_09690 [Bacteroidetes bacterium]|nr:hypothetical protein [Bacteroidota bacterium]
MENTTLDANSGQKLPSALNVLTILTFIGCALALISSVWGYVSAGTSYEMVKGMSGAMSDLAKEDGGAAASTVMNESLKMVEKAYNNRMIILLVGILGVALCAYGAMQMRKLKKQGFYIWLAGEVLPILAGVILVGGGLFGGMMMVVGMIVPAVFIILYGLQLKHMS